MNWTLQRWLPSGHRLFICPTDSRVAIADRSGSTPETTEDGVLWLDCERDLVMGDLGYNWLVPLRDASGKATCTPVDGATAAWLSAHYGMVLLGPWGRYRATEQIPRWQRQSGHEHWARDIVLERPNPNRVPILGGWRCEELATVRA